MDVTMPQLGETVAEATVTRWLKSVGEAIREGEPLFEVATDKVDTEIPASADGTLGEILVPQDRTVPVGTKLAVILPAGAAPAPPQAAPSPDTDNGNGNAHRTPRHAGFTPLVRKLLREHDLTPVQVTGTGPHGRITRKDVLAAVERKAAAASIPTPPAPMAPAAVPSQTPPPAAVPQPRTAPVSPRLLESATVVPFSTIRRRTAEHMVASKATSPHTLMAIEVDYTAVDAVRREAGLTYLPFIARAVVDGIADFPHVNASVGDDRLLVHRDVHLGIAVDLDADGLVAPVVRHAGDKRLRAIAREVGELAGRAREHKLAPDDFADGTFTISNPGPYGTLLTGAIINQPQVAILATDAVRPRPVAVPTEDGGHAVAVHPVGNLALTFDHRAIDGGYAARFLRRVRQVLEQRDWQAEL